MRLAVTYDVHGNITSLVASPPGSAVAYPEVKPGQRLTEIEAADLLRNLDGKSMHERLADLIQNYRVDIEKTKTRLTKKI
jgi:hypothetical protein